MSTEPHALDLVVTRHLTTIDGLGFAGSLYLIVEKGLKGESAAFALAAALVFGFGASLAVFGGVVAATAKPWRDDVVSTLVAAAICFTFAAAGLDVVAIWPMAGITGHDVLAPMPFVLSAIILLVTLGWSVVRTVKRGSANLPASPRSDVSQK